MELLTKKKKNTSRYYISVPKNCIELEDLFYDEEEYIIKL